MRGSKISVIAVVALLAGLGGCALPEVRPLAGGTTAGPSPYGPWYEQHWATNAILLAAAEDPRAGVVTTLDSAPAAVRTERAAVEAAPYSTQETVRDAELRGRAAGATSEVAPVDGPVRY